MSDKWREPVEGAAPLNHTDAETLISARLDGPLDPVMNRALQAHLATCSSCRAFASQMESMATAFRELPVLPPSPTVSRKVRAEIRSGGSPVRRFGAWVTTSKAAPATALAGAAVALALVTASVFGTFDDDNGGNTNTVNAPGSFGAQSTSGSSNDAALALTQTPKETTEGIANVQVTRPAPTQTPGSTDTSGADVAAVIPTAKQAEPTTGASEGYAPQRRPTPRQHPEQEMARRRSPHESAIGGRSADRNRRLE